jgi:hypothetical protein
MYCNKKFLSKNALGGHINLVHINPERQFTKDNQPIHMSKTDPKKWKEVHKKAMEKREAWRNDIKLTKEQEQTILGGLLGDASIRYGNKRSLNARVNFVHSLNQYEYCWWKYEKLQNIVKTKPRVENNGGYGEMVIRFSTMSLPCLTEIYKIATKENTTTITEEYMEKITEPIALAIWALDDGSRTGNIFRFSLGDRTWKEAEMLQEWMKNKWKIETKIIDAKKELVLYLSRENATKLKEIIEPHVIEPMIYKILFTT